MVMEKWITKVPAHGAMNLLEEMVVTSACEYLNSLSGSLASDHEPRCLLMVDVDLNEMEQILRHSLLLRETENCVERT